MRVLFGEVAQAEIRRWGERASIRVQRAVRGLTPEEVDASRMSHR